jgi:hypothetical protein
MHHWLADERPRDPTQLLQFNLGDTLQMLVYEQKAPWPVDINTAFGDDTYPVPTPPSGWNVYCDTTTT